MYRRVKVVGIPLAVDPENAGGNSSKRKQRNWALVWRRTKGNTKAGSISTHDMGHSNVHSCSLLDAVIQVKIHLPRAENTFPVVDPLNGIMARIMARTGILREKESHAVLTVCCNQNRASFSIIKSLNLHPSLLIYVRD